VVIKSLIKKVKKIYETYFKPVVYTISSEPKPMEEFVKITSVENEVEAGLLEYMLKEQQIPYVLRSYYDSALDGLYQLQKGWGYVSAPPRFREKILQILSKLRKKSEE
jgi:hypothetical protein